ncbi:Telomerase reverse transcriptase [Mycena sanguinolenta]|uniref:Glutathione peroxidase n=1 Tax=Mycena sanguinolenta TaxID=230812 RepID=A0A8H6Z926_9AGAR|nr:Telomerase reverse transcriptase [Mycena sanguinolenta]
MVLRSVTRPIFAFSRSFTTTTTMSAFYNLKATKKNDEVFEFSELKGKTVLIVNTASNCGFTPQYKGLQALYDKYKDKDFTIIGFPCNQFAGQEPGTDEEIATFCTVNHGVTFPLMKKSDVNGDNTNEVFKWLKSEKAGILGLERIKWNFEKFLVNKEGVVVKRWASTTTPDAIDAEVAKIV